MKEDEQLIPTLIHTLLTNLLYMQHTGFHTHTASDTDNIILRENSLRILLTSINVQPSQLETISHVNLVD